MTRFRISTLAGLLMPLVLLAACQLISGQRVETLPLEGNRPGVYTVTFVSAEGQGYREIEAGIPNVLVVVELSAHTERGEVRLEVLDLDGRPEITATARFGQPGSGRGTVRTDGDGKIALRITTTEAHKGSFTVRYRLAAPPAPTPTSPPTPAP